MTREEFNILNNLYEASLGRARSTADLCLKRSLQDKAARKSLREKGYIEAHSGELTEKGLTALEPYRVDSAVILAAGSATRFIPLSLEQPKGLYEVRGEKLIERQIQQLCGLVELLCEKTGCESAGAAEQDSCCRNRAGVNKTLFQLFKKV